MQNKISSNNRVQGNRAQGMRQAAAVADNRIRPAAVSAPAPSFKLLARLLIVLVISLMGFAGASIGVSMQSQQPPLVTNYSETLPIQTLGEQLASIDEADFPLYRQEQVRRGDTLSSLLQRMGVRDAYAEFFIRNDPRARRLFKFEEGQWVSVTTNTQRELVALRILQLDEAVNNIDKPDLSLAQKSLPALVISRTGTKQFEARLEEVVLEKRIETKSALIRGKFFPSADTAGVPDAIASQIADIFSGQLDMERDIRAGDQFQVIYEGYYDHGEFARAGRVLAVDLLNRGKHLTAVWFDEQAPEQHPLSLNDEGELPVNFSGNVTTTGKGGYYGYDGKPLAAAFLRNPLEFSRISSDFSTDRMHPVFQNWKAHTGVDFSAPYGTRIKSAGNGVVDFIGQQRGYGKVVIIKHSNNISTVYAHMSDFAEGMLTGKRVSQGQVIGYVGQTGWATGPHLHYEFRVADRPVDPMRVALPGLPPLPIEKRTVFKMVTAEVQRRMELAYSVNLASTE